MVSWRSSQSSSPGIYGGHKAGTTCFPDLREHMEQDTSPWVFCDASII